MMTQSLPMPGSNSEAPSSSGQPTFEEALERIREVVTKLESGTLTLEESIATYQEGSTLIEQCRHLIADAELRITQLSSPSGEDDARQ
jgi:exodeoxyribonuclease VII small subunit